MPTFGLISEGPTDHAVLENIIIGHYDDPDMTQYVRQLQPLRDVSDKSFGPGGWTRVLEYCQSTALPEAFDSNDYVVIHLDTDCLHERPFELELNQPVEILVSQVIEKLTATMNAAQGVDFIDQYQERLFFAIAVHQIECWLLPLYCLDKQAGAIKNCLSLLNAQLRKDKQPIVSVKKYSHYERLSLPFCRRKKLLAACAKNPSFKIFVESLPTLN